MPGDSFVPNFSASPREAGFPSREEIAQALVERQFTPYFQLQYHYPSRRVSGVEVLSRWIHPERGFVMPGSFIPQMEADGSIFELDRLIWDKACAQLRSWLDAGIRLPGISVNMSRATMRHPGIPELFTELVGRYDLSPEMLHIEITESAFNAGHEKILADIEELQARGFIVEMDDFGSGYSSLSFLKDAPVDVLKLDMAFLQNSRNRRRGNSILSSMVRLAYDLSLRVIAEGVETLAQAEFLKSIGCFHLQGYFFARPMNAEAVTEVLVRDGVFEAPRDADGSIENAIDFLDDNTQSALLFNSFVGGAYILEYRGDSLTIMRCNDRFYREMRIDPARAAEPGWDLFGTLSADSRRAYIDMLERAIASGAETDCEVCTDEADLSLRLWTHVRARYLARRVDSHIFYISVENITERKNLNRRNAELMAELSAVANNIPGGLARFRFRGEQLLCEYMSEGFCRMRGFDRDELKAKLNRKASETVHPDDVEMLTAAIERTRRENCPFRVEYRAACKGGEYIWVELSGAIESRPEGKQLFVYCEDITRQRELRSSLSASRRQLDNTVSAISGGTAMYEIIGGRMNILDVSDGAAAISGLSREEFMTLYRNDPMYNMLPQDRPAAEQSLRELLTTGKDAVITFRAHTKEGTLIWIQSHSHVDVDEDGRVLMFITFTNLSSSAALYLSVLNETGSAILVSSRSNREVLYANNQMAEMTGISSGDMLGRHCYECCRDCGLPCEECRARDDSDEIRCEAEKNGRRYSVRRKRIRWNGVDALITYMTDVTDSYIANLRIANLVTHLPGGVSVFRVAAGSQVLRTYANDLCADLLGYEGYRAALGNINRDGAHIHPEDLPELGQNLAKCLEARASFHTEFRVCLSDGIHFLHLDAEPFMDPIDHVLRYFALYKDVTQRRQGETMLRRSEANYRAAAQMSNRMICRYTLRDRALVVLEETAQRFDSVTFLENAPEQFVHLGYIAQESTSAWRNMFAAIAAGSRAGTVPEMCIARLHGGWRWYSAAYSVVEPGEEAVLAFEDITERRRTEHSLVFENAALFRALQRIYPQIITCNLTRNEYHIINYDAGAQHLVAMDGLYDLLISAGASTIPTRADRARFIGRFSRDNVIEAWQSGAESVALEHQQRDEKGETHWVRTTLLRLRDPHSEDLLLILVARFIDELKS